MRAGTDKTDPLYKAKIERQELIEQSATKGRRAQRELGEAMIEQACVRRLGDEAAAILAVDAGLTTPDRGSCPCRVSVVSCRQDHDGVGWETCSQASST
jgi:hypothetical protein